MLPKGTPIVTQSDRDVRLIQEKARQRQAMREYIIKERSNPFRIAAAHGTGFIEDPAYIRYESSQSFISEVTHFKPTMRATGLFLACVVLPIVGIGLISEHYRGKFEQKCRRGEIAYADRNNKFS